LFDGKMNIVGAFGRSFFKSAEKNKRKINEKREFFRKIGFWFVTLKQMTLYSLNYHWLFKLTFSIHDNILKIF